MGIRFTLSVCLYPLLLFMWPAVVGNVLCCSHVSCTVVTVTHCQKYITIGLSLFETYSWLFNWNAGLYTGWIRIVSSYKNCHKFICDTCTQLFIWAFFTRQVWYSAGMCGKYMVIFVLHYATSNTLKLGSVWSGAEYITALCTETFTIFYRKMPGKVIRHLDHNRRIWHFNHNGFM
jgi:hypothetical protein